jgi:hypothetical protein
MAVNATGGNGMSETQQEQIPLELVQRMLGERDLRIALLEQRIQELVARLQRAGWDNSD